MSIAEKIACNFATTSYRLVYLYVILFSFELFFDNIFIFLFEH